MGEAFWYERCPDCDGHGGDCQRCGGTGDIKIVMEACPHCDGEGTIPGVCPRCQGRGAVYVWSRVMPCDRCYGYGTVSETCPECKGYGEIEAEG